MDVLVVDGYNVIGAWDELDKLKQKDMEQARKRLIEILEEHQAVTGDRVIIVFDALYVKGVESRHSHNKVEIIYTKEDETADECIERLVKSLKTVKNQVYVATSDHLEQTTIFSRGALRISARELFVEIESLKQDVKTEIKERHRKKPRLFLGMGVDQETQEKLEKMRRGNR